jgi:hypothetical protein
VQRSYEVGRYVFGIRTNSEPVGLWLDEYLGGFRIEEEVAPYYSFLIADDKQSSINRLHVLYQETIALARSFDLRDLASSLLAELESLLFVDRDDALYAELAPIAAAGTIAIVPSKTVSFLDTLGSRVRRAGITLPVAVNTAIDPETGDLIPYKPLLDVPEGAADALGTNGGRARRYDRFVLSGPTRADVVYSVGLGEEMVQLVSRASAVYRMAKRTVNLDKLGSKGLEGLSRVVEGARCVEVRSSKNREMLDAIRGSMAVSA